MEVLELMWRFSLLIRAIEPLSKTSEEVDFSLCKFNFYFSEEIDFITLKTFQFPNLPVKRMTSFCDPHPVPKTIFLQVICEPGVKCVELAPPLC